jgi:hypothetical protein
MSKSSLTWIASIGLSVLTAGSAFGSSNDKDGQSGERVTIIELPGGDQTAVVTGRNGTRVVNKSGDASTSGGDHHDERVGYLMLEGGKVRSSFAI